MSTAAPDREVRGDVLVLGVVLSLFSFLLIFVTVVTVHLEGDDWRLLLPGVLRLSHSAFAGLGLFVALGAYRRDRSGWWIYAVAALIPIVQLVFTGLWFGKTHKTPIEGRRWTL